MIGRILATIGSAAVVTGVFAVAAPASEPSSASIDPTTTAVAWSGPVFTTGVALEDCAATVEACDRFLLTVDVDPAYWDGHDGRVDLGIGWRDELNDFDLYVLDEAGQMLASSTGADGRVERLSIDEPAGTYQVLVVPIAVTDADYLGWASLSSVEIPPPVETGSGSGGGGPGGAGGSGGGSGGGDQGPEPGNADGSAGATGPAGLGASPTEGISFGGPAYESRSFDSTGSGVTETDAGSTPTVAVPAAPPTTAAPVPSLSPVPVRASTEAGGTAGRIPDSAWWALALGVAGFALTVLVTSERAAGPGPHGPSSRAREAGPVASVGSIARGFPVDRRFVLWWG